MTSHLEVLLGLATQKERRGNNRKEKDFTAGTLRKKNCVQSKKGNLAHHNGGRLKQEEGGGKRASVKIK